MGLAIKINYANVDIETQILSLKGINFDAFEVPTITIGDTILSEVCSITSSMIECDLSGTPAFSTGTWTIYLSAGNSPHSNDEIDVFIPLGQTVQLCNFGDFVQCYSGEAATHAVGECESGIRMCLNDGTWGDCNGEILPEAEVCGDELDNDCDNLTDEDC